MVPRMSVVVLFKAWVANWPSCTLSSFWLREEENQDTDSFSLLPLRTVTWVCLLIVCHGLQRTGHLSDPQMSRNWAKCETKTNEAFLPRWLSLVCAEVISHCEQLACFWTMSQIHINSWNLETTAIPATRIRLLQGMRRVKIPCVCVLPLSIYM